MTRLPVLALRMLRYRVATMLWLFMLLGAAAGDGLAQLGWRHGIAAVCLAAAYVAATTVNDVADRDIDRVNHPSDPGRPLVSGEASERDLVLLHRLACALTLATAAPLGAPALALAVVSLAIGRLYSLGPVALSYRTWLAPAVLGVAYVLVPYGLGVAVRGVALRGEDVLLAGTLFLLFLARIVLKEFRDRAGDAAYGRPTLLLRFGKRTTCVVSALALVAGNVLLLAYVRPSLVVGLVIEGFVAAIASRLWALYRAPVGRGEQVAIGLGARMGNGLLLVLLGWLVLDGHGAGAGERTAFALVLAAAFALGFVALVARPSEAVLGYKG